jgi:phosphate transport system permease protein
VVGGSALIALAVLLATGSLTIVLFFVVTAALALPTAYIWSRFAEGPRRAMDRLVTLGIVAAFFVAVAPLVSLLYEVAKRGVARFDGSFFTESARGVIGPGGGAEHAIVGTLVITGVAALISVPIGIMAAVYLNEYGTGRLRRALTFFVDVMTGIPSIVAGLFAYALFAAFLGPGIRLGIIGSVALTVLMIPIVIRSAEEILKIVPDDLREAAYALGTPKWKVVTRIVLPTALAGLVTGVMLAVARDHGGDRLGELESAERADAEPRRLRLQRVQGSRGRRAGLVRQGLGRSSDADRDRDGPQPACPIDLSPLRHRASLAR